MANMNSFRRPSRTTFVSTTAVGFALFASLPVVFAVAPATMPADAADLLADLRATNAELTASMPARVLADPTLRKSSAGIAIPLLKRLQSDMDQLVALKPESAFQFSGAQRQAIAMLCVLGDKSSADQLESLAGSKVSQDAVRGQSGKILAQWYEAGADPKLQLAVVDRLQKLDQSNPSDNGLTLLTMSMSRSAATHELQERLTSIVTDEMTSSAAISIKHQLNQKADADATLNKVLDKPMTITGTEPDGKPFTTANWKGKVILVDFWATWCGPCKGELPRVKQIYTQYHPKGLELLGVSNDYQVDALKKFVVEQQMPWPELVDASAAADQTWNPITLGFGIRGIPTMFLIDKMGIARSVTAREDMETMIPKLLAEAD